MKIGDKVRFLSEVGGGKVAGFQGKNIVLVEDEDGFQIPTAINEVVVVEQDDYSVARAITRKAEKDERKAQETPLSHGNRSISSMLRDGQDEKVDLEEADQVDDAKQMTYRRHADERKGGNQLSAYIAFVPLDIKQINNPRFEVYLVNDSNYYMQYAVASAEGNSWNLQFQGEVDPNTKLFLDEIGRDEINRLDRLSVQMIAYKRDKAFPMKPVVDVQLRVDPVKFYKVHTFQDSQFFEVPCLLFTIVANDTPTRSLVIDPKQLKREMYRSAREIQKDIEPTQEQRDQLVRRYADTQSKVNLKNSPYIRHRDMDNTVVVDLHADELLDNTVGLSPKDILDYQLKVFRDTLADYAGNKGQKIVFIHGKGEGVLRRAIIHELTYKYKTYTYQDASFQEYGYGATQVAIR